MILVVITLYILPQREKRKRWCSNFFVNVLMSCTFMGVLSSKTNVYVLTSQGHFKISGWCFKVHALVKH